MRAERSSLTNPFSPDSGLVGAPRFGRNNPLAPGGSLPGLGRSFLSRLNTRLEPKARQFGLGDHIGVPVSHLEEQFTSALATAVGGLLSRARGLEAAAETLISGTPGGAFDRRAATSTSLAVAAEAKNGATVTAYDVDVSQLAVAQQNVGSQLLTTLNPSDLTAGVAQTFEIVSGGVTTPVTVTIAAGSTNLDALTEVRDEINAADAGVEASIVSTSDVSQLVLTSTRTGTTNGFTVTDVVGSVVGDTGTATATRAATDALVVLNGVDYTLEENKLRLDLPTGTEDSVYSRVTLFFQAVTAETARVDVTVSRDAEAIVYATHRLVGAVNELRDYVADKPKILSGGLLARLSIAVQDLRDSLAEVGIKSTAAGDLSVDEGALRTALDRRPADVERAIGSIQGLAAREKSVAATVLNSSGLAFATKPGPFGGGYGRTMMQTARLHNFLAAGLFVNFLA